MNRNSVEWKGYIPAITTPFTAEGELDRRGFQELLEWMVAEGMHGVGVAGTIGEWWSLTPAERKELFVLAGRQLRGRITVLGGCNAMTAREVIDYATAAKEAGLDGVFFTPPPYIIPNEREIRAFYQAVSDAVSIPICVYNNTRAVGVDISRQTFERLAEIEHVVAIKNTTSNFYHFIDVFFAVKDRLRVFGFNMDELGLSLILHHGGDGTIGGGGILGSDHPNFYNHIWSGDLDAARRCGARDRFLFESWTNPDYTPMFGTAQARIKTALNLRGVPGGYPRPPRLPLTEQEVERVRQTLTELGLVVAVAA